MKFEFKPSFESYFEGADLITKVALNSNSELISAIRQYHAFFIDDLFVDNNNFPPIPAMLALNSFMLFLSAIRVSLSGHEAATFPLFRTALESSCYAYLIGNVTGYEEFWVNRNRSDNALKKCRGKFSSAVKDTAKRIQLMDFVSAGTEKWINDAYDGAIDHGAHPNPKSLFPHMHINEHRADDFVGVNLVGLHSCDSHPHNRSMMACLDYGLLIALVLVCSLEKKSDKLLLALNSLNELKEKLSVELFDMEPI